MGGSFVRPKKVDFGISIIEALKQRYGQGGDSINEEDMYVMSGNNRWKAVEMVGADSIQQKQRYLILHRQDLIDIMSHLIRTQYNNINIVCCLKC